VFCAVALDAVRVFRITVWALHSNALPSDTLHPLAMMHHRAISAAAEPEEHYDDSDVANDVVDDVRQSQFRNFNTAGGGFSPR
jgi:hypothetical protein